MKKYNIYAVILLSIIFSGSIGCNKFLDTNNDPNSITDQNVTPELLFTGAEAGVGNVVVGSSAAGAGANSGLQFAYNWVGYMSSNSGFAPLQNEITYNINYSFGNTLWSNYYNTLYDLYLAKEKALNNGDSLIAGASMILSAKLFQEVVDVFGDAPYSDAFNIKENPTPKYDKAQDIYNSLLKSLDTAITYMNQSSTTSFAQADIINKGNVDLWMKFANTLKLRLLIRQSEVSGFNPSSEIAKINANGKGFIGAGETISVNPGYSNDVDKQSPFYANYDSTPTGARASASLNANDYIVEILTGTGDPRVGRFFTSVSGSYVGNVYGAPTGELSSSTGSSYFGPGICSSPSQNQWILTSFESLFFQAEAAARGWISGDAGTLYKEAVEESFVWLGSTKAAADQYMNPSINEDGAGIADWSSAGTTPLQQARYIAVQKYISNCCIDPIESWSDIRRLDMLSNSLIREAGLNYISVASIVGPGTLPVRLFYPQTELSNNGTNVPSGVTQFSPTIFWEQSQKK